MVGGKEDLMVHHVMVPEEIKLSFSQKLLNLIAENSGSLEFPGGNIGKLLDAETFDRVAAFRYVPRYEEWKAALQRLDAGEYGTCMLCGLPIRRSALQRDPLTRYCHKCESTLCGTGKPKHTPTEKRRET
jgi:RNA polymerase-binding transcription factor DksA